METNKQTNQQNSLAHQADTGAAVAWSVLSSLSECLILAELKQGSSASAAGCWRPGMPGTGAGHHLVQVSTTQQMGMTCFPKLLPGKKLVGLGGHLHWSGEVWEHPRESYVTPRVGLRVCRWGRLSEGAAL